MDGFFLFSTSGIFLPNVGLDIKARFVVMKYNNTMVQRYGWAMGAAGSSVQNSFKLWIKDIPIKTVCLHPSGNCLATQTLTISRPFTLEGHGLRYRYDGKTLFVDGLSPFQLNNIAHRYLKDVGISPAEIALTGIDFSRPFTLHAIYSPSGDLLSGSNHGIQKKIPFGGRPWIKISRPRDKTFVVEFRDMPNKGQFFLWDKNYKPFKFSPSKIATYQLRRARLVTGGLFPVIVGYGFNNIKTAVEHFASLNHFYFPILERPDIIQSKTFQL